MILQKPIVFFDLETTGVDTQKDRIVEIAIVKVNPDKTSTEFTTRINPEMLIPEGASEVHGITNEDVRDSPTFRSIASMVKKFMHGCDIAGFNSNMFDVPLLNNEFKRAGHEWNIANLHFIDVGVMFKRLEPRTLVAAAKFFLGTDLTDAHAALADTVATKDVFFKMMEKYDELPSEISEIDLYCTYDKPRVDFEGKFSVDDEGYILLNFGKSKGERAKDNINYVGWMSNADFSPEVKDICKKIIAGAETLDHLKNL